MLSLGLPGLLTLLSVAAAVALLSQRLPPRLPLALDGLARRHKVLAALYVVVALLVLVFAAWIGVRPWMVQTHRCHCHDHPAATTALGAVPSAAENPR